MNESRSLLVALRLPFEWRAGLPASDGSAAMRALHTAMALAEKPPTVSDEALGLELEVARLHQKIQLLIELLALTLQNHAGRPLAQVLALSPEHCQWRAFGALPVGSRGSLALWLHPAAPEPLLWPAEISACHAQDLHHELHAKLLTLGEAPQAALDRHVFLLHRRAIAEARALRP